MTAPPINLGVAPIIVLVDTSPLVDVDTSSANAKLSACTAVPRFAVPKLVVIVGLDTLFCASTVAESTPEAVDGQNKSCASSLTKIASVVAASVPVPGAEVMLKWNLAAVVPCAGTNTFALVSAASPVPTPFA